MKRYPHNRLRAVMAGMLLLSGGLMSAIPVMAATVNKVSESSAIIDIPLTLVKTQATCDLTFSGLNGGAGNYSYSLGELNRGERRNHTSFKAIIDCENVGGTETVSTALTASARGAEVVDNRIRMQVDGENKVNAPELWLETGGQTVPLDGSAFCQGNKLNRNECTLTPFTLVPGNSPNGQVSATVVFDITYV
ncbi:hypothetical protein [Yersinia enterocolitica]|uniref:hypothetical protein n=1 Tax=Yersinia enterocolitica TaxID=630 RepID=UPI0029AB1DEF|nr:hypothetical protein [Yersinia enterocolitica]HEI6740030.1 hypothetical protein [Yersinia enterocolitica]HEI6857290.1 hypothetical protein [Yersinia enterocolitica]